MQLRTSQLIAIAALALSAMFAASCGAIKEKKKGNSGDESDPHAGVAEQDASTSEDSTSASFSCLQKKTPTEFLTTLSQDLFRRGPSAEELEKFAGTNADPTKAVEWALTQSDFDTGIAYFVSNLLRIEQNLKLDPDEDDQEVIALLNDLKQEPIVLVQRNKDKPWPYIFTTQDIYCTSRTGALYDFPVDKNISGFVKCKMQPERAGILGLVSTLRAFSSAFYVANANRHRVAMSLYLTQGLQLAAKTDGPTGSGRPMPLAACVPQIDNRVSASGLVFGTAAVPKSGAVCAGCHSKFLAPLEPAFLRFDMNGKIMGLADIDKLNNNMLEGISKDSLKDILTYGGKSCFSANSPDDPPETYAGLPGMARLVSGSKKLGYALAVQIQQNLVNRAVDERTTEAIVDSYEKGGETLQAALKGFFLSEPYQCAKRGE